MDMKLRGIHHFKMRPLEYLGVVVFTILAICSQIALWLGVKNSYYLSASNEMLIADFLILQSQSSGKYLGTVLFDS